MNNIKNQTSNVQAIKEENIALLERLESLQIESENYVRENEKISDELHRQQTLYGELKKMRGRGEEMDLIQQMEQVHFPYLFACKNINFIRVLMENNRNSYSTSLLGK